MKELKGKLQDLLKQATEERSHYYVGSVIREVLAFLETSRDSTPTEGVGRRVVEEWGHWWAGSPLASKEEVNANLARRIDRALDAPRMTLDLRELHVTDWPSEEMAVVTVIAGILAAIRAQLPNVEVVTG